MSFSEEILHEAHRLQILLYIKERGSATKYDLVVKPSSWGAGDLLTWRDVLRELIDEDFVEQPPTSPDLLPEPLRLTELGHGYLAYLRARAIGRHS